MSSILSESLAAVLASDQAKVSASPPYHDIKAAVLGASSPKELSLAWPYPLENGVLDAVGNTPMLRLRRLEAKLGLKCKLYAKAEYMSVGGSVKDRISKAMVSVGEREQALKPGDFVIEATSGNTGIGLALMCAAKGYQMVTVMPDKMSMEKSSVMKALGAEVIRTRTSASWFDSDSHISITYKLRDEINRRAAETGSGPRAVCFDQYMNAQNPTAHYLYTGQEIVQQMANSPPTYVVVSAGTGGTISGISKRVKEAFPSCKVIGVDPVGSILHKEQWTAQDISGYEVEGIGYDFHPPVLSRECVDEWELVDDQEGLTTARRVIASEGILCGGSSGLAVAAALRIAAQASEDDVIVVVLPDSIRSYLSKFASDDWMLLHGWETLTGETKMSGDATPIADKEWNSILDRAPSLSTLPIVSFDKGTIEIAVRQCKELKADHCLVQKKLSDEACELRLLSLTFLRQQLLKGQSKKRLNEVDYRMSIQLFNPYSLNTMKAHRYLCAMIDQHIQDPILLVAEPQDVSESFPQQRPSLTPIVDGTHSSFTIQELGYLRDLKYVTVRAMTTGLE